MAPRKVIKKSSTVRKSVNYLLPMLAAMQNMRISKQHQTRTKRTQSRQVVSQNPLLPSGVNNKSTSPQSSQTYTVEGEEVIQVINTVGTDAGETLFNTLINPHSVRRLGILADAFQRIDWLECVVKVVPLNGSVVNSGYTMGVIEDPESPVPMDKTNIIAFLTALRSTSVRQAWVASESGQQVSLGDKPEMYTQRGSDVRRYSPGRVLVAAAGNLGAATFQIMLRYRVRLYVPIGIPDAPGEIIGFDAPAADNLTSSGASSLTAQWWGGINVFNGETVVLTHDILCTTNGSTTTAVMSLRTVAAGTKVTLGASGGYRTITGFDKPDGEVFYLTFVSNTTSGIYPIPSSSGSWRGAIGVRVR